jgi:anti-sigma factor RsiW
MSEAAGRQEPAERDLHALVDGEIAGPRVWAVLARLAADPDAAERAAAYARQRVALALLRESVGETDVTPRLGALGEALRRALGPLDPAAAAGQVGPRPRGRCGACAAARRA